MANKLVRFGSFFQQRDHIAIESLNQIVEEESMCRDVFRLPVNGRLVVELWPLCCDCCSNQSYMLLCYLS